MVNNHRLLWHFQCKDYDSYYERTFILKDTNDIVTQLNSKEECIFQFNPFCNIVSRHTLSSFVYILQLFSEFM